MEIPWKSLGNSKEIPRFSYKRGKENVTETSFIHLLHTRIRPFYSALVEREKEIMKNRDKQSNRDREKD